ncbi:Diglucosyl diacylglycerol synthase (1,6-linking)-like protein [Cladobotryum mycophilum]|uniref:Diglucosyl diacylglycerol synthase (1,6-linking)-like protein n=1 Tax=Cladobotryum mycophilum TaxID=491253 RepID=A0ABR0SRG6_9HYPO
MTTRERKAIIISASVGAGHDAVAAVYASRLRAVGFTVIRKDFAFAVPTMARLVLHNFYAPQVQHAPDSFTWMIEMLQRPTWVSAIIHLTCVFAAPTVLGWIADACSRGDTESRSDEEIDGEQVDLIVTTYPMAAQTMGLLRSRGWLNAPVIGHVTDPGFHPLWFHLGVDLHLASLPETVQKANALGYQCTRIDPLVQTALPKSLLENERLSFRRRLGLEPRAVVALITTGSLGLGTIEDTVKAVLSHSTIIAVVMCGQDGALRKRLEQYGRVIPFGWQENMTGFYAAADILVHNASYMAEEGRAIGLPLVTYNPLPGHGLLTAAAYERAGLSEWPKTPFQLATAIDDAFKTNPKPSNVNNNWLECARDAVHVAGGVANHAASDQVIRQSRVSIILLKAACIILANAFYALILPVWLTVLTYILLRSMMNTRLYRMMAVLSIVLFLVVGSFSTKPSMSL